MQRGSIRQHGGIWVLQYRKDVLGPDGVVKSIKTSAKLGPVDREHGTAAPSAVTKSKAEAILAPINARTAKPETDNTLFGFIDNVYMPSVRDGGGLSPATVRSYEVMWKLILPYVNGRKLRDIRTADVAEILTAVAGSKARARTSLLNARNFLSGAFRYAIEKGLIDHGNPVREVNMRKINKQFGLKPVADNNHAYTLDEIAAIISALDEPAKTAVAVTAFSGLRKGEVMGLKWEDFTGDELYVRRSVWGKHIGGTKTDSSEAPVPVIGPLRSVLEAQRKRTKSSAGWIFPCGRMEGSKPLNFNNLVRREIIPALEKAGLEWHGWHAFRRGLGSNLYALGVPDKVIQRILRHSDVQTTQRHYVKTVDAQSVDAMRKLELALSGSRK